MKTKKIIRNLKSKFQTISLMIGTFMILSSTYVYAEDNVTFDNVTAVISEWAVRLGGLLAFWGGIQVAMAFQSEDAGGKRRGVLELVGGLMVVGIAVGYETIFGL